jgi:2-dehydro-3-deoxyphosphogluconate aldolase/(4S)-4-hydroxy-2-oxoglutarate aldolase
MTLLSQLHEQFIIPVIRATTADDLESVCLALAQGGLKILEITLMNDDAFAVINKLAKQNELIIGAGTVLTSLQATKAIDAGAQFLVSPGLNIESLAIARANNIAFFPGVLTPTEIMQAKEQQCELLKLFPIASLGGANYLKLLQAPFPELKWMATGGITLNDIKDYLKTNAICLGLGGQLISAEKIRAKDWQSLSLLATMHLHEVKKGRAS